MRADYLAAEEWAGEIGGEDLTYDINDMYKSAKLAGSSSSFLAMHSAKKTACHSVNLYPPTMFRWRTWYGITDRRPQVTVQLQDC
jgi:hypothetical protein